MPGAALVNATSPTPFPTELPLLGVTTENKYGSTERSRIIISAAGNSEVGPGEVGPGGGQGWHGVTLQEVVREGLTEEVAAEQG